MDAVDEQVGVAVKAQAALPKRGVVGLPLLGQPADRAGRQPRRVLAEQIPQRRREVAGRQAAQVQDRQHVADLRRAARVGRQDPRAELPTLTGLLVDALVVDARRLQTHRPGPDRQATLAGVPVTHDETVTVLIDLADERRDVLLDLDLQRRGDHPASALPGELVERDRDLFVPLDGEPANIHHGVPSCRPSPASVFINREGTPPSFSSPSTTSGYISVFGHAQTVGQPASGSWKLPWHSAGSQLASDGSSPSTAVRCTRGVSAPSIAIYAG